jgi:hypothetical protein
MAPCFSAMCVWSCTPSCMNWSDANAVRVHEATIIEMTTLWRQHEEDIIGWTRLSVTAGMNGNNRGMREYSIRANHSAWVRFVLMERLKFRACGFDPHPNAHIQSFSMPELPCRSDCSNGRPRD